MASNVDKFQTNTEHAAVDHTTAPLNLLNTTAHALINHSAVSGAGVSGRNNGGAAQGPRTTLNFIPSGAAGIAVVDNPGQSRIDVTVSATAEAFTSGVHATTNHAGITGVTSYSVQWGTSGLGGPIASLPSIGDQSNVTAPGSGNITSFFFTNTQVSPSTAVVRKNGGLTSYSIAVAGIGSGSQFGSVAVAAGDELSVEVTSGGSVAGRAIILVS